MFTGLWSSAFRGLNRWCRGLRSANQKKRHWMEAGWLSHAVSHPITHPVPYPIPSHIPFYIPYPIKDCISMKRHFKCRTVVFDYRCSHWLSYIFSDNWPYSLSDSLFDAECKVVCISLTLVTRNIFCVSAKLNSQHWVH